MSTRSRGVLAAAVVVALSAACTRGRGTVDSVRPAVLEWQIGINAKDGPTGMVETILPATYRGKPVWRVVHRDLDPTVEGSDSFDMYDVDRATLAPVRSVMRREGFSLSLAFEGDRVEIERREGDDRTVTEARVRDPRPEGPGASVHLAALPLQPGYASEFPIVDRWAKDEAHRIARLGLTVRRRARIETRLGVCDALDVLLTARDGSFSIQSWVRAEPPHYPFSVEYTRGDTKLVSDVTRMIFEGGESGCSAR